MLELKQIESYYPASLRPFKRNLLREYLQYKILESVFMSKYAGKLSFMGGTAIHIIHSNTRFSEDLDFDDRGLSKGDFAALAEIIKEKLRREGYEVEVKSSFKGAYRASVKIADILFENGISAHREEKLLIHVDAEPQGFSYLADRIIINKFDVFAGVAVVPVDILLAQKLYAILARKRPMGRDFFDAIFLFGKTSPNPDYLKEKLAVAGMSVVTAKLLQRCRLLNFDQLARDVKQFLFDPCDARKILLFREYIESLPGK